MNIEEATLADWLSIEQIYREGIRTRNATFESEDNLPDAQHWFRGKIPASIFKAVADDGRLAGWAALATVSDRCVYAGVAEVSVYVAAAARGQGVGTLLMQQLVTMSEASGIWTLQAGIFPENEASLLLHKQAGFREVGRREKLGKMDGVWRDVILLERRSTLFQT